MNCKKCGAPLSAGDKFCKRCGERTDTGVSAAAPDDRSLTVDHATDADIVRQNKLISQIWPDWTVTKKLGEGSFGKVYEAQRNDMGAAFSSAIKVITIPQSTAQVEAMRAELGVDEQTATTYFRAMVDDCVNEIKMMESFKGTQNIVSVEDYKVVSHRGTIGWTILIRMELLTAFTAYSKNKTFTEQEVIKLGVDICNALEYCAKLNVMHRDIKPENIFVSNFGDFKLGDFGIARKLERANAVMSKKGTYNYMAPEVYNGGVYDYKSDLYSLGIVLYKLMNNNRFPLIDARNTTVTYQQMQAAFEQRMAGAPFQKPANASEAFAAVILTACAYRPEDRFVSATAMKQALLSLQNTQTVRPFDSTMRMAPPPAYPAQTGTATQQFSTVTQPVLQPEEPPKKAKKAKKEKKVREKKMTKGKKALAVILVLLIALLGAAGYGGVTYLTSREYKVVKALNAGDYDEARAQYDKDMADDLFFLKLIFDKQIDQKVADVKAKCASGELPFDEGIRLLETLEGMDAKRFAAAAEVKDELTKMSNSQAAYKTAQTKQGEGDYAGAIENYKKVAESDAQYEDAQKKLKESEDAYRTQVLKDAADAAAADNLDKAVLILTDALAVLPGDAAIQEKQTAYQDEIWAQKKEKALADAKQAADQKDFKTAIDTVNTILSQKPDDVDLRAALQDFSGQYVAYVVGEVDRMTKETNFVGATNLLDEALKELPDNETLKEKKAAVDAAKPVSLSTLDMFNGKWEWDQGTPVDPTGKTFTDICNYTIFSGDGFWGGLPEYYAEYYVNKQYKLLTFELSPHKDISETGVCKVQVYADETLVKTIPDIGRKSGKTLVNVDIPDAEYVKIVVTLPEYHGNQALILMNAQLWAK